MRIKDIANALHLSVSTVSKALNGAFDVSAETKAEVLEYARKNGYKSKDERISSKKLRRLCFLYDNVDLNTQTNLIIPLSLSFTKHARENNFEVVSINIKSINTSYDTFMNDNNFDGAFIAGLNYESPILKELKETKYPTVLFDNDLMGEKIATINNENINTISLLVHKLKAFNHTKIGFIHGDKHSFISNERFAGYIIGLTREDLKFNQDYVYLGDFSEQSGYDAAKYFASTDVTAIICSSDIIAAGLIKGLNDLGLKVPNDISVTGYDDLDIAKYTNPTLTTIKQDIDLLGEKGFTLLTSMMKNRSSQRIIITGEVIVRDSINYAKN